MQLLCPTPVENVFNGTSLMKSFNSYQYRHCWYIVLHSFFF